MQYRNLADSFFRISETVIYVFVGLLLIAAAIFLVISTISNFIYRPDSGNIINWVVTMLDRTLLMLMLIEILYTVRVSFKDRALHPEPFLIVALIATVRRILIISVEMAYVPDKFVHFMIEISILGGLTLVFVLAIILMRKFWKESI